MCRTVPSANGGGGGSGSEEEAESKGKVLSSVVTVGGLAALIIAAAVFQEPIKEWILYFSDIVDDMGYPGMVLYFFVYVGLEVRFVSSHKERAMRASTALLTARRPDACASLCHETCAHAAASRTRALCRMQHHWPFQPRGVRLPHTHAKLFFASSGHT